MVWGEPPALCRLVARETLVLRLTRRAHVNFFLAYREPFGPQPRSTGWRSQLIDGQDLWKRISEGNACAFDAFYRDSGPHLRVFLRHLLPSEQAAEDVMQDTFTQIWGRPGGFNPEHGSLRGYLFGIGRKLAAEWWRRQKTTGGRDEDSAPCPTEISSIVADAFNRLTREQRTLLWLREVEGQSYGELAAILEVPIGTVRSRLFAAREALRKIWHSERVEKGRSA